MSQDFDFYNKKIACLICLAIMMYYICNQQYISDNLIIRKCMTIIYSKVLICINFCDLRPHIFVVYFVYIIFYCNIMYILAIGI